MPTFERLTKNAPGDFYGDGFCLACGIPENVAPDLMSTLSQDNWDTYFVRQPKTPDEIERACEAVLCCCMNSLHYAGRDATILKRLGNRLASCDDPLPGGPVRFSGESDRSWTEVRHSFEGKKKL